MAYVRWICFMSLVFTVSQTQAGVTEWYYRCCSRGRHKAKNFNGNIEVCEKDDLDQRRFTDPMNRMICRMGERICCMQTLQVLSCERGKYQAYQGKSCKRVHGYSGSDRFVKCCDCCALGLKAAQERNVQCTDVQMDKSQLCHKVYHACCSGKNTTIAKPNYTFPPVKPVTTKAPVKDCGAYGCQHICRKDRSKNPVCYCYNGYLIGNDGKSCVDIDECLMGNNDCKRQHKRCINTPGSYRCVAPNVPTTATATAKATAIVTPSPPQRCQPGFSRVQGRCQDNDECAGGLSVCGHYAECINTQGSYRCVPCQSGHRLRNNKCEDVDECKERRYRCRRNEVCENTKGSYKCVSPGVGQACSGGHRRQGGQCVDVDECKERRYRCASDEVCENTKGSYKCVRQACQGGHRRQGGQCVDVDECKERRYRCTSDEVCENTKGSYKCVSQACSGGHRRQGGQCVDVDECKERRYRCTSDEVCENTKGSYKCVRQACPSGHRRQGGQCVDIDECREGRHGCTTVQVCRNTQGSYSCASRPCASGHRRKGSQCVDIDECKERRFRCARNEVCENTKGSYKCVRQPACPSGYRLQQGLRLCVDINECSEGTHSCSADQSCLNLGGSYQCFSKGASCRRGFRHQGDRCVDINECAERTHGCPADKDCQNTRGSYTCVNRPRQGCLPGYTRNAQGQCEDVNECAYIQCQPGSKCTNLPGTYKCISEGNPDPCTRQICPNGYRCVVEKNTAKCEDIDECQSSNPCKSDETCRNIPGRFYCQCPKGYKRNQYTKRCEDVNECLHRLCAHFCTNTRGSYKCTCRNGYKLAGPNNTSCTNINECETLKPCQGTCQDVAGSFYCSCGAGYRLGSDRRSCEDINECVRGFSGCSHNCVNTPGSYKCTCRAGWALSDGRRCIDVDECRNDPTICGKVGSCANTIGSYECISFPCPPYNIAPEHWKYYFLKEPSLCKKKRCTDSLDTACFNLKDKGYQFWTFSRKVGDAAGNLFSYIITFHGYNKNAKVDREYKFWSGNEDGLFEIKKSSDGRVQIRNRYPFPKAKNYKLEFVGELRYDGDVVSRYTHYLHVFVYS